MSLHSSLGRSGEDDVGIIPVKEEVFYRFLAIAEMDLVKPELAANAHLLRTLARLSNYRVNEERLRKDKISIRRSQESA